jgi:hypothetical protein
VARVPVPVWVRPGWPGWWLVVVGSGCGWLVVGTLSQEQRPTTRHSTTIRGGFVFGWICEADMTGRGYAIKDMAGVD